MKAIRVLIVDDSVVVRDILQELLSHDRDIEVVGSAVDPYDAREKIKALQPDVITLDIEMPRMDGVTFLRNLMRLRPMPVIMISTLTKEGADITFEALQIGAVDYLAKPLAGAGEAALEQFQRSMCDKIKTAALTAPKLKKLTTSNPAVKTNMHSQQLFKTGGVIAIGASTGGTEALRDVINELPLGLPPVVVTQHIPISFSERFARRLNQSTQLQVIHAKDGQLLKAGCVYIAPGDRHLQVRGQGEQLTCRLLNTGPVNRHKPSVEVMFDSILAQPAVGLMAVMLTGMGDDGAKAMKRLRDHGVHTVAQDEASSLVWGMPGSAVRLEAAEQVLPLIDIASAIVGHYRQ